MATGSRSTALTMTPDDPQAETAIAAPMRPLPRDCDGVGGDPVADGTWAGYALRPVQLGLGTNCLSLQMPLEYHPAVRRTRRLQESRIPPERFEAPETGIQRALRPALLCRCMSRLLQRR
jgi:hypothetical protein